MSLQKTISERITRGRKSGEDTNAIISQIYSEGIGLIHLIKALKDLDQLPGKEALALVLAATSKLREFDEVTNFREAGESHCNGCGEPIFRAIPGETTQGEIKNFIESSPGFEEHENMIDDKIWLLPGGYCPNGCTVYHFNSGSSDLWERFEQDRQERETAAVSVINSPRNKTPIERFKIYLDGYIRSTSRHDSDHKPELGEYLTMEPGDHAIVVRDFKVHDPHRRESNKIEFSIAPNERIEFTISETESEITIDWRLRNANRSESK